MLFAACGSQTDVYKFKETKTLQKYLLDPDSIILYEVYVNEDYSGERAVLFYFGARNKAGGITDDWAFVSGKEVQFESSYNDAVDADDTDGILENGDLVFALFAIQTGSEKWVEFDF